MSVFAGSVNQTIHQYSSRQSLDYWIALTAACLETTTCAAHSVRATGKTKLSDLGTDAELLKRSEVAGTRSKQMDMRPA